MIAYLNGNRLNDVHFHQGGGNGGDNIFAEIGYSEVPQVVQDGIDYAKEIQANWDASKTDRSYAFSGDTKLVYFPEVDTSNVTNMRNMFANSPIQTLPSNFNTSNVTSMQGLFQDCSSLASLDLSHWVTSKVTNMAGLFQGCDNVIELDLSNWDTSNVTNIINQFANMSNVEHLNLRGWNVKKVEAIRGLFAKDVKLKSIDITGWDTSNVISWCDSNTQCMFSGNKKLVKVDGYLDLSNCKEFGYISSSSFSDCGKLQKLELRNMGKHSGMTAMYFYGDYSATFVSWGKDTDDVPDARQSMINTLITYSFNRAAAGYSTCTISLTYSVKNRLTTDEIAQITAKGYTIA